MGLIETKTSVTLDPELNEVGVWVDTAQTRKALAIVGEVALVGSTDQYLEASIVDTTNVATGTYYPSSAGTAMGAYKNLSITGKLIDGAGETTTLTIEGTNDDDVATGDWVQVYMYDVKNDANVNSVAATNQTTTFALMFDNFNFKYYRLLITATAATNTVIIKVRRTL